MAFARRRSPPHRIRHVSQAELDHRIHQVLSEFEIVGPFSAGYPVNQDFDYSPLYPLLRRKYYIDDFYIDGLVNPIKGPIAQAMEWFNGRVIDGVVNGAGLLVVYIGRYVYVFDQRGIDGVINSAGASTGGFGGVLRVIQTGKVQQYAAMLIAGTLLLVAAFIIFG